MKGLIIWAQSSCRSTMGLYVELYKLIKVPIIIALWHSPREDGDIRSAVGLNPKEFNTIPMISIGDDLKRGIELMDNHRGFDHLFAAYQSAKVWRLLINEAKIRGERIFIGSEAPCNMDKGLRYIIKEFYLRMVLPLKVKKVITAAHKFFNYSGDDDVYLKKIGWPKEKIIPFGYFPPPLQGSSFRERKCNSDFKILATGVLSRYRGADILVEALRILSLRGVKYRAVITQSGELLNSLREKAKKFALPIDFPGFLPMPELIGLYESCSVYVGAGRHEPWGMRLNDALNCGAPLVVSTGMGGVKMIKDYGCGLSFENMNAVSLADALELLATDESYYLKCAANVKIAAKSCRPEGRAKELYSYLIQGL